MPALTLGTLLTVASVAASGVGMIQASQASSRNAEASAEAEAVRKRQMLQEASRKQREIFRQSQLARATAVANAGQSGTLDSSGIQGAIGQIDTQTGQQTLAVGENAANSSQLFGLNAEQASAQADLAMGNSLRSFGSTILSVKPEIERIGETLFGSSASPTGRFGRN